MSLLTERVNLAFSKIKKLNRPKFRGQRWPWLEPQKDAAAAIALITANLRTRSSIIAENAGDFEDTADELARENQYLEDRGLLKIPAPAPPVQPATAPDEDESEDQDTSDDQDQAPEKDS
jgi:capsid protein